MAKSVKTHHPGVRSSSCADGVEDDNSCYEQVKGVASKQVFKHGICQPLHLETLRLSYYVTEGVACALRSFLQMFKEGK